MFSKNTGYEVGYKNTGYEVGYQKPPKHGQFKKGQSGNPKGRPKGSLNTTTVLEQTLRERVTINENGQRKTITKLEAAMKQLVNKAAFGDLQAVKLLMSLIATAEERLNGANGANGQQVELGDLDQKMIVSMIARFQKTSSQGDQK